MFKLFSKQTSQVAQIRHVERRAAIAAEHFNYDSNFLKNITKYPKSKEDEMFIKSAIENNDFLNSLLREHKIQDVVDCMYPKEVNPGQVIIKQGDEDGTHLYISLKGTFEVFQNGILVTSFSDVRVFGELALLYNSKRFATVKAKTFGKIWILDRLIFKYLMVQSELEHLREMVSFLEQVPKLNSVHHEVLEQVAVLLKLEFYPTGTKIILEGDNNTDKFYIIRAGSVTVSKNGEIIDKLYKSNFFGELALLEQNERKATITADAPGTECLTLTREEFLQHFGEIPDCFSINIQIQPYKPIEEIIEHTDLKLEDFKIISILSSGTFGKVELVQHTSKPELVFALKSIKKKRVPNERNIQISCKDPFIVRLYRTYQGPKYIHFLLEPCLGGDMWCLLNRQKVRQFCDKDAKFYAACVVEALHYIHERGIIYRDLKLENLLIDARGYIKLTDFGSAKILENGRKTYTITGTPEYIPPEIILNRGYDKGVDYWALGGLIFELLTGRTPFWTDDPTYMQTYKLILNGLDEMVFPSYITIQAEDLVRKLCKVSPAQRLGCQNCGIEDIKVHRWFATLDWEKLREGKIVAPFKPNLRNNVDVHYFYQFSHNEKKLSNDKTPQEWNNF